MSGKPVYSDGAFYLFDSIKTDWTKYDGKPEFNSWQIFGLSVV